MPVFVDHKLKLTYDDLREIPEDDPYRHEIIDGMHVASPSPVRRHQYVSKRLQYQLYTLIELAGHGEMYAAPMDVELGRYDVFEPDLLVILNHNAQIMEESHIRGVPDLAVEILSPCTASRDRGIKREQYEKAGIPEYWVVDANVVAGGFSLHSRFCHSLPKEVVLTSLGERSFRGACTNIDH